MSKKKATKKARPKAKRTTKQATRKTTKKVAAKAVKVTRAAGPTRPEDPTLKLVRDLARLANEYDLDEIEVGPDGFIRVARAATEVVRPPRAEVADPGHAPIALVPPPEPTPSVPVENENTALITSPFVGTFYRASSPDADPFVEVGQTIRKGQVVCIVEAMKLMNEIEAEADGKLEEVMVKNGEHVQYGAPLFRLAKL